MANLLLSVCEFADVKIGLADKVIDTYNEYMACDAKLMGLSNKVIRGEVSKEYALNLIDEVIKKNSELTEHAMTFYTELTSNLKRPNWCALCFSINIKEKFWIHLRVEFNIKY